MPFNGSGGTSQPSGSIYPAVGSTLIESAKSNASIADIYTMLASCIVKDGQTTTTARIPFASGISTDTVTEKTSDTGVTLDSVLLKDGRIDTTQGSDIASAATVNLETATGNVIDVTGTTTITAITLSQGHWRLVRFTGILTLTHGASLVIPGAANVTTAAGDYALFIGYASSVVRCAGYWKASGITLVAGAVTTSGLTQTTARMLGRTTASTGAIEEITIDPTLTLATTTLSGTQASATQAGVAEWATQAELDSGAASRVPTTDLNKLTLATEIASTSGSSVDFTGIPTGVRRITIQLVGVSTNGTATLLVRLGDSGGFENSGYLSTTYNTGAAVTTSTTDFILMNGGANAADVYQGRIELTLENASTFMWTASWTIGRVTNTAGLFWGAGSKATSAVLDRVQVLTTDTFDAGAINIIYER